MESSLADEALAVTFLMNVILVNILRKNLLYNFAIMYFQKSFPLIRVKGLN